MLSALPRALFPLGFPAIFVREGENAFPLASPSTFAGGHRWRAPLGLLKAISLSLVPLFRNAWALGVDWHSRDFVSHTMKAQLRGKQKLGKGQDLGSRWRPKEETGEPGDIKLCTVMPAT